MADGHVENMKHKKVLQIQGQSNVDRYFQPAVVSGSRCKKKSHAFVWLH